MTSQLKPIHAALPFLYASNLYTKENNDDTQPPQNQSSSGMGFLVFFIMLAIVICLWVYGFRGVRRIPEESDSKTIAMVFAILGIFAPLLEIVPIVMGSFY